MDMRNRVEHLYDAAVRRASLALVLLCAAAVPVHAAPAAGVVIDASGAPVAGAVVTVGTTSVTTGDDGRFTLPDAPTGTPMEVKAAGFATVSLDDFGDPDDLRIVLHPAALTETVVVTASRGSVRLSTPEATTVLTAADLLTMAAGSVDDALRNTPGFSLFRRSTS